MVLTTASSIRLSLRSSRRFHRAVDLNSTSWVSSPAISSAARDGEERLLALELLGDQFGERGVGCDLLEDGLR